MLRPFLAFFCLVTFAVSSTERIRAEEPIFVVQSSGSVRLLQVLQEIGLPDPITSAGLDTQTTLARMSQAISLNATSGGVIYVTPERPHLIVCLPLSNAGGFMSALEAFSKNSPTLEASGVYSMGQEDKFYAKQAGTMLLLSDSPKFLNDAASTLSLKPWASITDDIKLTADFQRLLAPAKAMLMEELLSLTTVEPTSGLYFNAESMREYLKFGLQKYLFSSLFDCRSFELALNIPATGEVHVKLSTQEDTTTLRTPSMFTNHIGSNASFALDFTSKLSEANTQTALKWAADWEKEILAAIDNDSIQDKSDLNSAKRVVKFFTALVSESLVNRKIDSYISLSTNQANEYLAGAVALNDSAKIASLLTDALNAARPLGLAFTDLKANGQSSDAQADYLIDLPSGLLTLSANSEKNPRLHIRIANQVLWLGVGNEGERLRQVVGNKIDGGLSPMSLYCDIQSTDAAYDVENLLPLNFRKLKLNVQVSEVGRVYEVVLSNPGAKPATPSVSAQAAAN